MKSSLNSFSAKQLYFKETFVGTLIYAVVLGFFNDYSDIVEAKSFSTIFFSSVVLEILTYLAFSLKSKIINWLNDRQGAFYKALMVFFVWLVMFASKFIFIWVLDLIFGSYISINGFFGILLVVLCFTITHKLANKVFEKLGDSN